MCAMPLTSPVARMRQVLAWIALCAVAGACSSCDRSAARHAQPEAAVPLRIASLSPAITECVVELGLGDRIVGRTPWCERTAPDVPVVGTLLDVDAEALVRCAPTLVVVQPPAQGIDPALDGLVRHHGWTMRAWRINGLDDARAAMDGLAEAVADADPVRSDAVRERHAAWCALLESALEPLPAGSVEEPVLVMAGGLEGMSFGRGTYIDDALARIGVRNAVERPGYPALSVEDVVRLAPRIVVVIGGRDEGSPAHADAVSAVVIRVPPDGLGVPGGRLPHGLKTLRDALARVGGESGG